MCLDHLAVNVALQARIRLHSLQIAPLYADNVFPEPTLQSTVRTVHRYAYHVIGASIQIRRARQAARAVLQALALPLARIVLRHARLASLGDDLEKERIRR